MNEMPQKRINKKLEIRFGGLKIYTKACLIKENLSLFIWTNSLEIDLKLFKIWEENGRTGKTSCPIQIFISNL